MDYIEKYKKYKKKYLLLKNIELIGGYTGKCPTPKQAFRNVTGQCWLDTILNILLFNNVTKDTIQLKILNLHNIINKKREKKDDDLLPFNIVSSEDYEIFNCFSEQFFKNLYIRFINRFKSKHNPMKNEIKLSEYMKTPQSLTIRDYMDEIQKPELKRRISIVSSLTKDETIKSLVNINLINKKETIHGKGGSHREYLFLINLFNYYFMNKTLYFDIDFIKITKMNLPIDETIITNACGVMIGIENHVVCYYNCGKQTYYYDDNRGVFCDNSNWKDKFRTNNLDDFKLYKIIPPGFPHYYNNILGLYFISVKNNDYSKNNLKFFDVYLEYNNFEKIIKNQLAIDPNVNKYYNSKTLLYMATIARNIKAVLLLISHPEIDVNKMTNDFTPLYIAAHERYSDVVEILLRHPEIDVNKMTHDITPLYKAAIEEYSDVVKILLSHPEIDVNKKMPNETTPLYTASERGHIGIVRLLIEHINFKTKKPDININDLVNGMTPLYTASQMGHTYVVHELLKHPKIDVNIGEESPLYTSSDEGYEEVVIQLVSHSDIDVNMGKVSPLYAASEKGHSGVVKILLSHPEIDVNKKMPNEMTPLYTASERGHIGIVRLLIEHINFKTKKPDININDLVNGRTPLYTASENGHADVVNILLEHPEIDVNICDIGDAPPLYTASLGGYEKVVLQLVSHPKIEVNKSFKAYTPLSIASQEGHSNVVNKCYKEFTPLNMASQEGHSGVVEILLSHRDIDVNMGGVSSLYAASKNGHRDIVKILLRHPNIDVNKGYKKRTPLYIALHNNYQDIADMLIAHGGKQQV